MLPKKTTVSKLPTSQVLRALSEERIADVIVVGKQSGTIFVATSMRSGSTEDYDEIIRVLEHGLADMKERRRSNNKLDNKRAA